MIDGIVCPSLSSSRIGPDWIEAIHDLQPARPLSIRAGIGADQEDHVDVATIRANLQTYKTASMPPYLVLESSLSRYHELHPEDPRLLPNAPLGLGGDPTLSDWINRYSLTACSVLKQLGPDAGIQAVWVANEPNLLACDLKPGDAVPQEKAAALSPAVYAALLWTTASRLRAEVPWLTNIWPAAFSQLVYFFDGADKDTPWFTAFWTQMIAYLRQCGKMPPWPWESLQANLEGPIGHPLAGTKTPYVEYVALELSKVKSALGIDGISGCAEWGSQVHGLDVPAMTGAYNALHASPFAYAFFFEMALMGPGSYGAVEWAVAKNGVLIPGAKTPWYGLLQTLFAGG